MSGRVGVAQRSKKMAAAGAAKATSRLASDRSPTAAALESSPKQLRGASKSLFAAPTVAAPVVKPKPSASAAAPTPSPRDGGETDDDDNAARRGFSTPEDGDVQIPAKFRANEDDSFSYRAGALEGRQQDKTFAQVFDKNVYKREPFFQGFTAARVAMEAEKKAAIPTPPLREAGRSGPVAKANIDKYVVVAKAGPFSAMLKSHTFGDAVAIEYGDEVFSPAREFFYLQGEEGELKALVSHYLRSQLGEAYDLEVFNDAWESGTEMEVATKRRKAALTGVDKSRIKTTNKTITLRFETRIMKNNARAALVLKLWQTYREVLNLPKRPKGEQIQGGQKRHVIEDPEWEVHAKQMQVAAASTTSRYGMPFMEGKFSADAGPDDDQSMDPVGLVSAVHVLAIVFKGCTLEEEELREKIAKGELLDFSLVQIALFATVITDKIKLVRRGATTSERCFDDQVRETMKFLAQRFEHYGWTGKEGSKPAFTKLVKISDYPPTRPMFAEDDPAYYITDDGIKRMKAVPLAGQEAAAGGDDGGEEDAEKEEEEEER